MSMEIEIIILIVLIVVFIASFCGLLQKIRKTYERDRELTERVTRFSSPQLSLTEIYINPTFASDSEHAEDHGFSQGVFPSAPPPYTEIYYEPPPKYEDIIKENSLRISITSSEISS